MVRVDVSAAQLTGCAQGALPPSLLVALSSYLLLVAGTAATAAATTAIGLALGLVIGIIGIHEDEVKLAWFDFDVVDGRAAEQRAKLTAHHYLYIAEFECQIIVTGFIEAHAVLHSTVGVFTCGQAQGQTLGTALCSGVFYLFNGGGCQCNHAVAFLFT